MSTVSLLVGAATDTTAETRAKVTAGATSVRLALSTQADMSAPIFRPAQPPDGNGELRWSVSGLTVNTRYYAALEIDGVLDTSWVNTFLTDPSTPGQPGSFTCGFFSCAPGSSAGVSTHMVHEKIAARQSTLNIHLGDFGYPNIATNDPALFRANWEAQITGARPKLAWRSAAFHYMVDDHDFGADNSNSTSASKPACATVYRQKFPHPPLVEDDALHHAFTKGRVRFIVTDERWYRDPQTNPDVPGKTMLGAAQLAWFEAELLAAKAARLLPVWVSSQVPSYGLPGEANWGDYQTERAAIWDFLADSEITDLVVLAGDLHCMGYMLGQDYSTAQAAPVDVYVSSPLENAAGGMTDPTAPWQAFAGGSGVGTMGHYAILTVDDQTTHIAGRVDFYAVTAAGAEARAFTHSFTWGNPPLEPGIYAVRDEDGVRRPVLDSDGAQRYVTVS